MTPSERPYLAEYVVSDAEAERVGLSIGGNVNNWGELLRPVMIAKGCPEDELFVGNPRLVTHRREGDKTFFRLYHKPTPAPRND